MASSLARNIPMIIATAALLVSMYILWKYVTRLEQRVEFLNLQSSSRLDQLTNELYYSMNDSDDRKASVPDHVKPYVIDQNVASFQNDGASSVPSEDVVTEHERVKPSEKEDVGAEDGDVNAYIGNLQDKFVTNNEDDADSIVSDATFGTRKKSPPQSAASFPVGHQQMHNGKLFEVIKTKKNVTRWGKPTISRESDDDKESE